MLHGSRCILSSAAQSRLSVDEVIWQLVVIDYILDISLGQSYVYVARDQLGLLYIYITNTN